MKKKYYSIFILLLIGFQSFAQDPQLSQFYAAPLYHNPAFAGGAYAPRLIVNYRNQWPSIDANFITAAFSADYYIEKLNSGVGLLVMNDSQGPGSLKTTEVSGIYSYQLQLDEENHLRFGAQATYSNKTLANFNLIFGDQFATILTDSKLGTTSDPLADKNRVKPIQNIDFSTGALYYNKNIWLGVSAHHLNKNKISFVTNEVANIMKLNVIGGYKFILNEPVAWGRNANKELSVSPTFLYKRQYNFSQLDLGFYATYASLTAGAWYRGIPLNKKSNINQINHDAFIFLLGYRMDNFSIGYSYDLTISGLKATSGGAHEISIAYQFQPIEVERLRKRRNKKELSCPRF